MKKKRILQIIISIIAFYFLLTVLLFAVETIPRSQQGSSITSLGDAAWYLLATLTTVGYGDVTPVTMAGKIIGAVMMISSAGVLTFLIGLLFTMLFGRLLPCARLWCLRNREWYVFSALDETTQILAGRLAKDAPDAAFVFCGTEETLSEEHYPSMRHHVIMEEPLEVLLGRQNREKTCHLFLMTENGWDNYGLGCSILEKAKRQQLKVYCEADHAPDSVPDGMILFDRADSIARYYWTNYPVQNSEKTILLIGDGRVAKRLLERGLLINVLPKERSLSYHVFGDWTGFQKEHYELAKAVSVDSDNDEEDSIFFEEGDWRDNPKLLQSAGRIIFCGDEEKKNLSDMVSLRRYFVTKGCVDVYTEIQDGRCRSFGGNDQMLSGEMVMQEKLNRMAIRLNDFYREKTGGGSSWAQLSEFHRQSNIAAADHLLTKIRLLLPGEDCRQVDRESAQKAFRVFESFDGKERELCRWLEHKRWMRFHQMNNWSYAPVRENELRHHTLLVPYEELTKEEQALDDSAWEILGEIK